VGDALFTGRIEIRLSESVKASCPLREGEKVLKALLADILCLDPEAKRDHQTVILVITDCRILVVETKKNIIFYPNFQVGSMQRSIELGEIVSMQEREIGMVTIGDVVVSEGDPLVLLELWEVARFEGLKIMRGRKVPHASFLYSLQMLADSLSRSADR